MKSTQNNDTKNYKKFNYKDIVAAGQEGCCSRKTQSGDRSLTGSN